MSGIVSLNVNGRDRQVIASGGQTLLSTVRDDLGLTGVGRGCADGSCGACTLLVDGMTTLSCLVPVVTIDGSRIRTIEGEATDGVLSEVQQAFIDDYATQCGFCTSGMILAATALLESNPTPTRDDVNNAICGNVCRCTGYRPIVQAVLTAAAARSGASS
jgi:aerobic carbon-monoxide dehydrogenase small subunit